MVVDRFSRRAMIGGLAAMPALAVGASALAREAPAGKRRPVVLVHGSWLGGWSWKHVAAPLRAAGYEVFTPTMTGVGERAHLMSRDISLDTWVRDICGVIEAEELQDVILVGHSFGGRVVTGVADRMADRVDRVIFLDSALAQSGRSLLDQLPPAAREKRIAETVDDGKALPPPSAEALGIHDAAGKAWFDRRASPQPFGTNTSSISFSEPIGGGRPVTFVAFTAPLYGASERALAFAKTQSQWRLIELPTGHCPMISDPDPLAKILLELCA